MTIVERKSRIQVRAILKKTQGAFRDFIRAPIIAPLTEELWPHEKPVESLDLATPNDELFKSHLFIEKTNTQELKMSSNEFWKHFDQYQIADVGLDAGTLKWSHAREMLYEAMGSSKSKHLTHIYIFWMETLQNHIDRAKGPGGSVEGAEAWSDRMALERTILNSIRDENSPMLRAELTAYFIYMKPSLSHEEKKELMVKASKDMLTVLPDPSDFARTYKRYDPDNKYGRRLRPSHYEPHGNDLHRIIGFINLGNKCGFGGEPGKSGGEIGPIQEYLQQVLMNYDPALGDPYITSSLLTFSRKDYIDKNLQNMFLRRVMTAAGNFGAYGFEARDQDTLLQAAIDNHAMQGNIRSAYRLMKRVKNTSTLNFVAGTLMGVETLRGTPNRVERKYKKIIAPVRAKQLGRDVEELLRGRSSIAKDEKRMWILMWALTGASLVEDKNNYDILNRDDVIKHIRRGSLDHMLPNLAEVCTNTRESHRLNKAILSRVRDIFEKDKNRENKKESSYSEREEVNQGIQALLKLRNKQIKGAFGEENKQEFVMDYALTQLVQSYLSNVAIARSAHNEKLD